MLESVSASEDETLITRFANLETPKFMVENKSISIKFKFTVKIEQKSALKFSLKENETCDIFTLEVLMKTKVSFALDNARFGSESNTGLIKAN